MRTSFGVAFALIAVGFISIDSAVAEGLRGTNDIGSETRQPSETNGSGSTALLSSVDGNKTTNYHHGHQKKICEFGTCWYVDIFDQNF
ncbi:hypothetical protein PF001_g31697 [Phytophthora fragariae]|uniref:RxLR effector protein n=2 Tax=Phytophthora fragariae TaxID=53985 RepID=A0A6A4AXM2_9STRA|nr:hypothetical protein PF006_g31746 [Phytophthora fragariae]KAE9263392.1 hypothetical protein PF001_g31697 [Phytophthora fragariae]